MATFPVKYLHSGMRGAPVLSGTAGTLVSMIDACLLTGFGQVTLTSLVVSGGVATATVSAGDTFEDGAVILTDGATPATLNGEQRVLSSTSTTFSFATSAPDGAATGTITAKYAPVGGWEKSFSGTNKAVYKSTNPLSNGHFVRVDDNPAYAARVVAYESMTDVDTGVGPFPTPEQMIGGGYWSRSSALTAVANKWRVFGDSRFFVLAVALGSNVGPTWLNVCARGFGDPIALAPSGDAWSTVISCGENAYSFSDGFNLVNNPGDASTYRFMPRAAGGVGGAVRTQARCVATTTKNESGNDTNGMGAYPSVIDGKLRLARMYLRDASATAPPRALVPGIYYAPHTGLISQFAEGEVLVGTDELAGRRMVALYTGSSHNYSPSGVFFMDTTGPWR